MRRESTEDGSLSWSFLGFGRFGRHFLRRRVSVPMKYEREEGLRISNSWLVGFCMKGKPNKMLTVFFIYFFMFVQTFPFSFTIKLLTITSVEKYFKWSN